VEQDGRPVPGSASADGWLRRPFARTFDLLSSEYGWTDSQILDLTLARMRQARDVIWERRAEEWKRDLRKKEQELRTLAGFIAGAAGWKDGVKNAARIELYERSREERLAPENLPATETVMRLFGDVPPEVSNG